MTEQTAADSSPGQVQARRVEAEAAQWQIPDLASLDMASEEELPVLDLTALRRGQEGALDLLAAQLRKALGQSGFFLLSGHGCEEEVVATLAASRRFHTLLPQEAKEEMAFSERGVGYLRINQRILPRREKGNMNEAFIVKRELGPRNITLESNPFPREADLPGFRQQVKRLLAKDFVAYRLCSAGAAVRHLDGEPRPLPAPCVRPVPVPASRPLLPGLHPAALQVDSKAISSPGSPASSNVPLYRLRLSHYPPPAGDCDQFGINPHTDTSFITLLAQVALMNSFLYQDFYRYVPFWSSLPPFPSGTSCLWNAKIP